MNIEQAKAIPLALILETLSIKPVKSKNHESWYRSPFRNEKTASFKINQSLNLWYDFGEGVGGNTISFAVAWLQQNREDHTIYDGLRWLKNTFGNTPIIRPVRTMSEARVEPPKLILKSAKRLNHISLIRYAESRGIPSDVARTYLKEVTVQHRETGKTFFALGLQNEDKGFELRNPFLKSSVGAKTITFIRGTIAKPEGINLFEGMMDFLSVISRNKSKPLLDDTIILNSLSCMNKATPYITNYGYKFAYTWMDNDPAGQKAKASLADFIATENGLTHRPQNGLYRDHEDVNAWHMHTLGLSL